MSLKNNPKWEIGTILPILSSVERTDLFCKYMHIKSSYKVSMLMSYIKINKNIKKIFVNAVI